MPSKSYNLPAAEFAPGELDAALHAFDRRDFLKLMGAALAAAGTSQMGGCSRPQPLERIVPYVRSPEHLIPGVPAFYASTLPTSGFASGFGRGIVVESHEGRPTKIEGNPHHPSSLGSTDIFMQAAVLQLYDPSRSKIPLQNHQGSNWGRISTALSQFIASRGGPKRVRVKLVTRTLTSPTLAAQLNDLHTSFPNLTHHIHDTPEMANARDGQTRAFGRAVMPRYDFTKARRIVSLDDHFFSSIDHPGALRHARDFSQARRIDFPSPAGIPAPDNFPRLYMAESSLTFTGARADHRLAVPPSLVPHLATALAGAIFNDTDAAQLPAHARKWIAAAALDLKSHPRESLILVGECQPGEVHALAAALNALLQAPTNTLHYLEPVDIIPAGKASLSALTAALKNDADLLILIDVNPAFTAPGDLAFAEALAEFTRSPDRFALHVGAYMDETATLCSAHLPLSHSLECWADFRAHDGTISFSQPLIEPLWNSRSIAELFSALLGIASQQSAVAGSSADLFGASYDLLRRHWFDRWKDQSASDRQLQWRRALRDGVLENTAAAAIEPPAPDAKALNAALVAMLPAQSGTLEITFRPDPTLADGESGWANHPWLQELPKPFTHTTWDNLALISPATADALGLHKEHESREMAPIVRVTADKRTVDIPVWVQAGHPDNTITLHIGGGHTIGGIQKDVGTNVYTLRSSTHLWHHFGSDVHVAHTGCRALVACTQPMQSMAGRDIARTCSVSRIEAATAPAGKTVPLSLYQEYAYTGYKWGMVIDLSACIGCNACVTACQAENNIPAVGKEQVRRGRVMHWLRIDTYQSHDAPSGASAAVPYEQHIDFQPMLCQHCENAPCELVCPVEATSHSAEGINEMTYNRCVGTRYCSNNCPYKVRRFNFFDYNQQNASHGVPDNAGILAAMQKNPNVTVRSRGVMEKCTYCIQRINRARIGAERDWARSDQPLSSTSAPEMRTPVASSGPVEPLPRLNIQTACQQSCPAQAITFGDMNDAAARVTKIKALNPLNYGVLAELNTQPRTTYLQRLVNPNPAMTNGGGDA